jgi:hypothetical protein
MGLAAVDREPKFERFLDSPISRCIYFFAVVKARLL